jgi:hypothetical protein
LMESFAIDLSLQTFVNMHQRRRTTVLIRSAVILNDFFQL